MHQQAIQSLVMPVTAKGWLLILPYVLLMPVLLVRDHMQLWSLRRRAARVSNPSPRGVSLIPCVGSRSRARLAAMGDGARAGSVECRGTRRVDVRSRQAPTGRPARAAATPAFAARGTARDLDRACRPIYCVWEITLACDLACRHCGSRAGHARPNELSTSECIDLVRPDGGARRQGGHADRRGGLPARGLGRNHRGDPRARHAGNDDYRRARDDSGTRRARRASRATKRERLDRRRRSDSRSVARRSGILRRRAGCTRKPTRKQACEWR